MDDRRLLPRDEGEAQKARFGGLSQAVCSFHGFRLYSFLQAGDVLDGEEYDFSGLPEANHDLRKLHIAVEIAKRV